MDGGAATYRGNCHCGAVGFKLFLPRGIGQVRRCNCSLCRMRGAVVVTVPREDFVLLCGEAVSSIYRFHTRQAQHHFCTICGIYTHHVRRSDPNLIGVNVACVEGMSPFDFAEVPVMDGMSHPSDTRQPARIAGILHFERF